MAVPELGDKFARVLGLLGAEHALVVHGQDGMDEISVSAPTQVHEVRRGELRAYTIEPEQFGLQRWPTGAVRGGAVEVNVRLARGVLDGEVGPSRDVLLLNAGAAMYVAGLAESIQAGIAGVVDELDSGRARTKVEQVVEVSQRIRAEQATADVA